MTLQDRTSSDSIEGPVDPNFTSTSSTRLTVVLELYLAETMSFTGTLTTLPIIDIAPFLNSEPSDASKREATAAALHNACVEYGFFYLNIEAYINPSEPEELAHLAREFFTLPQEEKDKLSLKNQDFARGMHCKLYFIERQYN